MSEANLIYDWNLAGPIPIPPGTQVLVNDETLRDGLQNPSIQDPTIEDKIEIVGCQRLIKLAITRLYLSLGDTHTIGNCFHNVDLETNQVGRVFGVLKNVGRAIDIIGSPL